jgi:hypothetical protein
MKRVVLLIGLLLLGLAVALAFARAPKSYQVTGPVLEVDGDHIIVQKGRDKWELSHDKDTTVTGELKKGSMVTIHYVMKATKIEVKGPAKPEATTRPEPPARPEVPQPPVPPRK